MSPLRTSSPPGGCVTSNAFAQARDARSIFKNAEQHLLNTDNDALKEYVLFRRHPESYAMYGVHKGDATGWRHINIQLVGYVDPRRTRKQVRRYLKPVESCDQYKPPLIISARPAYTTMSGRICEVSV